MLIAARHTVVSASVAIAATFALAGCSEANPIEPEHAKAAIVKIVDRSTAAIGGDWSVYEGPAVQGCTKPDGGRGAAYAYTVERDAMESDARADIATIEKLWKERGITTQPYESGGDDPVLGIRGAGGPTVSIDLLADTRGYSITGVSECAEGDAATMRGDGD